MRFAPACAVAALACLRLAVQPAQADERILSYHSDIAVNADGTLEVRETLLVRAEGVAIRHGIFRDFPTHYRDRAGRRIVVGFDFEGATRDGAAEPYRIEGHANGKRIYLGRPDGEVTPGEHTYVLAYRAARELGYFSDHDELYWNVTGNGWAFPIDAASAAVTLPVDVAPQDIRTEGYTGAAGSRDQDLRSFVQQGVATFVTTRYLDPRAGLTIVVSWPKGHVAEPTSSMRARYFVHDALPFVLSLFGLAALLLYYVVVWLLVGGDPRHGIVVPLYEPPDSLSPAAMRYLLRMRYDDRCFGAAILSLAVKGYLTIDEPPGSPAGRMQYTLTRTAKAVGGDLARDEKGVLEALLDGRASLALNPGNYDIVGVAKTAHRRVLQVFYRPGFFDVHGGWHALGILISIAVLGYTLFLDPVEFGADWFLGTALGWAALSLVAAGLALNGVFGRLLFAPTARGRTVMDHIEGFKLYLGVAEAADLQRIQGPPATPELYQQYLPAALALGVEQRWAERFASVFAAQAGGGTPPAWYRGSNWDSRGVGAFSHSLATSLDSSIASASSAPGSSSGSGGGGSSGGGGGGGGGGGW